MTNLQKIQHDLAKIKECIDQRRNQHGELHLPRTEVEWLIEAINQALKNDDI